MSIFRALVRKLGPGWLVKETLPDGTEVDNRILYSIALVLDALAARIQLGILARFPGPAGAKSTTPGAPEDALSLIGRDRIIIRGPNEASDVYALRLIRAIDDHRVRGNAWALMEQIRGYCSPHEVRIRTVDQHGNWKTLERDGSRSEYRNSAWDWDGTALEDGRARFWVLIYPTTGTPQRPWQRSYWGAVSGDWGEAKRTWGSTATTDDVASIRKIVRAWKPAGTSCKWIVIVWDDTAFDPEDTAPPLPDGTWRHWSKNSAGTQVATRDSSAMYWLGTGWP